MRHSATGVLWVVIWVFLAAPWLAWVVFHPLADARLAWALVAHPREVKAAMREMLRSAYDVPPFSFAFKATRQPNAARLTKMPPAHYGKPRSKLREFLPNAELPKVKQSGLERCATRWFHSTSRSTGCDRR
jgi:hypothetical protein